MTKGAYLIACVSVSVWCMFPFRFVWRMPRSILDSGLLRQFRNLLCRCKNDPAANATLPPRCGPRRSYGPGPQTPAEGPGTCGGPRAVHSASPTVPTYVHVLPCVGEQSAQVQDLPRCRKNRRGAGGNVKCSKSNRLGARIDECGLGANKIWNVKGSRSLTPRCVGGLTASLRTCLDEVVIQVCDACSSDQVMAAFRYRAPVLDADFPVSFWALCQL